MEGAGPLGAEHLACRALRHTVRQRERETLGHELLGVWALNIRVLLDLDNLKDLFSRRNVSLLFFKGEGLNGYSRGSTGI